MAVLTGADGMLKKMLLLTGLLLVCATAQAERLKDVATIHGVRANQLIGYGLVVGLNGSGDQTTQTPFTVQTFNNMLAQFGIKVPSGGNIQLKNVAAVSIHAELPPFAAGTDHRHHGFLDRQRQEPARRQPADGAAQGSTATSTPSPRQPGGRRFRCRRRGRFAGHRQLAVGRAHPRRRDRRAAGAERLQSGQYADAEPQSPGLHHGEEHR